MDWMLAAVTVLAKSSVLLAAAGLLAATLRRSSGRIRSLIWASALVGALMLPVAESLIPSWRIDGLAIPRPTEVGIGTPELADPSVESIEVASGSVVYETTAAGPQDVAPQSGGRSKASVLLASVWAAGALLGLLHLAGSLWRAAVVLRRAQPPEDSWSALAADVAAKLGIRRRIRVLMSEEVATPMTGGWWRPVILLPAAAERWPRQRLRLVLIHELVHVRRGDWLIQLAARAARAIYWPNPLVWVAHRYLVDTLEEACDETVVALGARPSEYAGHLLEIAESLRETRRRAPATALAMIQRSQLEGRLMTILSQKTPRRGNRLLALTVSAAVATLLVSLASFEIWAEDDDSNKSGSIASFRGTWSMHFERGGGPELRMHSSGDEVELSDDGSLSLQPGASVLLEATSDDGSHQRLEIIEAGSGREYRWSVDGEERPFDAAAQDWMDAALAIFTDRAQIGRLRGKAGALRGKIGALRGKEGALRGKIGALRGKEGALRGKIGALRGKESALRGQIGALRGKEGALRGQIGALRAQISITHRDRSSLFRLDPESDRLSELDAKLEDHQAKMIELEKKLASFDLEAAERDLERQIADLETEAEIAAIEDQIAEIETDGEIAEIEEEIRSLDTEGEVAEIEGQIKDLDVERRVNEIESGLEAKYKALRRVIAEL